MFQGPGTGPVKYQYTIILPDGTVLVPALAFATDPASGLYLVGANQLGISVGGVARGSIADTTFSLTSTSTTKTAKIASAAGTPSIYLQAANTVGTISATVTASNSSINLTHISGTRQGIATVISDRLSFAHSNPATTGVTLALLDIASNSFLIFGNVATPAKTITFAQDSSAPSLVVTVADGSGSGSLTFAPSLLTSTLPLLLVNGTAAVIPLTIKLHASQSASGLEVQDSSLNALFVVLPGGGVTINEQGNDSDTRIESDTEANMVFVDAGSDVVYLGGNTAGVKVAKGGDEVFVGAGSGLPFGCCHGDEIAWSQASMVQGTFYPVSDADIADGPLNLVTHDGSGKLTVTEPGKYLATFAITAEMNGANNHCKVAFMVSGTATTQGEQHAQFVTANAEVCISSTTILDLADDAYVEVGVMNPDAGTPTIIVDHLDLTLVQVGG